MMREIAAKAGNFRGVCPLIGRLRDLCERRISSRMEQTGLSKCRFSSCRGVIRTEAWTVSPAVRRSVEPLRSGEA